MMGFKGVMEPKGMIGSKGAKELRRLMKFKEMIEVRIKTTHI